MSNGGRGGRHTCRSKLACVCCVAVCECLFIASIPCILQIQMDFCEGGSLAHQAHRVGAHCEGHAAIATQCMLLSYLQ